MRAPLVSLACPNTLALPIGNEHWWESHGTWPITLAMYSFVTLRDSNCGWTRPAASRVRHKRQIPVVLASSR